LPYLQWAEPGTNAFYLTGGGGGGGQGGDGQRGIPASAGTKHEK
jgi:hypothetical protein